MTNAELINKLKQFPPNIIVIIEDADTGWALNINKIYIEEHYKNKGELTIILTGDYGDLL